MLDRLWRGVVSLFELFRMLAAACLVAGRRDHDEASQLDGEDGSPIDDPDTQPRRPGNITPGSRVHR